MAGQLAAKKSWNNTSSETRSAPAQLPAFKQQFRVRHYDNVKLRPIGWDLLLV